MTPLLLLCPRSDCVIPDTLIVFVTYLLTLITPPEAVARTTYVSKPSVELSGGEKATVLNGTRAHDINSVLFEVSRVKKLRWKKHVVASH